MVPPKGVEPSTCGLGNWPPAQELTLYFVRLISWSVNCAVNTAFLALFWFFIFVRFVLINGFEWWFDDVIRTPLISKILAKKFELAQVGRTLFPHFWVPPTCIRTLWHRARKNLASPTESEPFGCSLECLLDSKYSIYIV